MYSATPPLTSTTPVDLERSTYEEALSPTQTLPLRKSRNTHISVLPALSRRSRLRGDTKHVVFATCQHVRVFVPPAHETVVGPALLPCRITLQQTLRGVNCCCNRLRRCSVADCSVSRKKPLQNQFRPKQSFSDVCSILRGLDTGTVTLRWVARPSMVFDREEGCGSRKSANFVISA